jgi:hypothetical protein
MGALSEPSVKVRSMPPHAPAYRQRDTKPATLAPRPEMRMSIHVHLGDPHTILNGEVVLQARLQGVEAPANQTVQRILAEAAAAAEQPGMRRAAEVLAEVQNYSKTPEGALA